MTNTADFACQSCGCSYSPTVRRNGDLCGDVANTFHIPCAGAVGELDTGRARSLRIATRARDSIGKALAQVAGVSHKELCEMSDEAVVTLSKSA